MNVLSSWTWWDACSDHTLVRSCKLNVPCIVLEICLILNSMTLHQVTEIMKKALIIVGGILGVILLIVFIFQIGVLVKNALFPPEIKPPTQTYGKLPKVEFPANVTNQKLTYTLNTITGGFPSVPDRLGVFPIFQQQPNFLNLNKAKDKVASIGFKDAALVEIPLGNASYEWRETAGIQRIMIFNTITFDFILQSNYLSSSNVLNAQNLVNQAESISVVKEFLQDMDLLPVDIDFAKTQNPPTTASSLTAPQLFAIQSGHLVSTTSLSNAQVIRVELYQNNLAYDMNSGRSNLQGSPVSTAIDLPIFYPHPPYSTMSLWVASGRFDSEVVAANFVHKTITIPPDTQATYSIKTPRIAFEELKAGKGYIAAYDTEKTGTEIAMQNISLGYYLDEGSQKYAMPIYVFEGRNGFLAYISAVSDAWIE